jgi:hypothetical protein
MPLLRYDITPSHPFRSHEKSETLNVAYYRHHLYSTCLLMLPRPPLLFPSLQPPLGSGVIIAEIFFQDHEQYAPPACPNTFPALNPLADS